MYINYIHLYNAHIIHTQYVYISLEDSPSNSPLKYSQPGGQIRHKNSARLLKASPVQLKYPQG